MNSETSIDKLFSEAELISEVKSHGRLKRLAAGDLLIRPGETVSDIPIVLSGSIRILREDADGREIFLYHLYPSETCAMSITCCQAGRPSMVKAVAEENSELLLIPLKKTEDWFRFAEWKAYVSLNYNRRFEELIGVIDLIAFHQMDEQLIHYLRERSKALRTNVLQVTHQQIADELHAHREAVSRLLRVMEQKGLVKLGRNSVQLINLN